jgi:hypothetical protein
MLIAALAAARVRSIHLDYSDPEGEFYAYDRTEMRSREGERGSMVASDQRRSVDRRAGVSRTARIV